MYTFLSEVWGLSIQELGVGRAHMFTQHSHKMSKSTYYYASQNWRHCQLSSPLSRGGPKRTSSYSSSLRVLSRFTFARRHSYNAIQLVCFDYSSATEFAVIFLPTLVPIIQKLSVRTRWDDVGNGHSVACGVGYCWLSHASDSHISRVARPVRRATPEMNPYCPSVDGFSLRILNFRIHPS